jgi:hypothetical protein
MAIILLTLFPLVGCARSSSRPGGETQLHELPAILLSPNPASVECYDFIEFTLSVVKPEVHNPFTDVFISGRFAPAGDEIGVSAEGFCDSADGSHFRIRFMPIIPGEYTFSICYWQNNLTKSFSGAFKAIEAKRRGILGVDPQHPWHFIWRGTGEHYFFNGTTAFLLMGWEDENVIRNSIERLHDLKVNRIRVLLDGRTDHFWTEPIRPGSGFRAYLNPWDCKRPDDIENPGIDYSRFNPPYWQKFERMLRYACDKDIVISVIFGWNDTLVHPQEGSADERRYLSYALARLGAYSNVNWDLGDDLDSFRSTAWTHTIGSMLFDLDPYHHLATSHPAGPDQPQDRTSPWFGMTSFQVWERPLHAWMLEQRRQQTKTGRIIPQTNEEYGYEDHYPRWAPYREPGASADANRRAAWEMVMAGGYQTTGETAKRGTGVAPDTGGGWVNGRGDDTMIMLKGYAHIVQFFTSFEWWRTDPHDEMVNNGAYCLAEIPKLYVVYLPHGGDVTMNLAPDRYEAKWFDPRTGTYSDILAIRGPTWTSPLSTGGDDWVLLVKRTESPS